MKPLVLVVLSFLCATSVSANSYQLFAPLKTSDYMECWGTHYPNYTEVFGHSSLGHVFLRTPSSNDYIVLHPFKSAAKSYGEYDSIEQFENSILKNEGFAHYVLRPDHVANIEKRLGTLSEHEIYIPKPYPFLGGDESVESYEKGDVWIMLSIVDQFFDLCS